MPEWDRITGEGWDHMLSEAFKFEEQDQALVAIIDAQNQLDL